MARRQGLFLAAHRQQTAVSTPESAACCLHCRLGNLRSSASGPHQPRSLRTGCGWTHCYWTLEPSTSALSANGSQRPYVAPSIEGTCLAWAIWRMPTADDPTYAERREALSCLESSAYQSRRHRPAHMLTATFGAFSANAVCCGCRPSRSLPAPLPSEVGSYRGDYRQTTGGVPTTVTSYCVSSESPWQSSPACFASWKPLPPPAASSYTRGKLSENRRRGPACIPRRSCPIAAQDPQSTRQTFAVHDHCGRAV